MLAGRRGRVTRLNNYTVIRQIVTGGVTLNSGCKKGIDMGGPADKAPQIH